MITSSAISGPFPDAVIVRLPRADSTPRARWLWKTRGSVTQGKTAVSAAREKGMLTGKIPIRYPPSSIGHRPCPTSGSPVSPYGWPPFSAPQPSQAWP
jgi:hypothetical protein